MSEPQHDNGLDLPDFLNRKLTSRAPWVPAAQEPRDAPVEPTRPVDVPEPADAGQPAKAMPARKGAVLKQAARKTDPVDCEACGKIGQAATAGS